MKLVKSVLNSRKLGSTLCDSRSPEHTVRRFQVAFDRDREKLKSTGRYFEKCLELYLFRIILVMEFEAITTAKFETFFG